MSRTDLVMLEQDLPRLEALLGDVRGESNARFVLLLDKNGQQMASSGDIDGIDATAVASLAAGNIAATEGLARLVGENGFSSLYHEGRDHSLHLSVVAEKVILMIVFDERSSVGLVRLRVQQHTPELASVVGEVLARTSARAPGSPAHPLIVGEISDEDIEALFA